MMTARAAIARFERLYLASTVFWVAGTTLSWDERRRMIAATPALTGYEWLLPALYASALVLTALFWWLIVRRRSATARLTISAGALISLVAILFGLLMAGSGQGAWSFAAPLRFLASALNIGAAAQLFGAGARRWFDDDLARESLT